MSKKLEGMQNDAIQPISREAQAAPAGGADDSSLLSEAGTNKINRTGFTSKSTVVFATWFGKLTYNMVESDRFEGCIPSPAEIAATNTELQGLKTIAEAKPFKPHTTNFGIAVDKAKVKCDPVAQFIEKNYPRDARIAALLGMKFNQKAGVSMPAPTEFVTNVDTNKAGRACLVTWENLAGFAGKGSYNLYMSADAGLTFNMFCNPARPGCSLVIRS